MRKRGPGSPNLQATRKLTPDDRTNLPLIAVLLHHRLFPQAEETLTAGLKRTPHDRTLALLLAKVYSETDRGMPQALRRTIEGEPESPTP